MNSNETLYEGKNTAPTSILMIYKGTRYEVGAGETIKNLSQEVMEYWRDALAHTFMKFKKMSQPTMKDIESKIEEVVVETPVEEIEEAKEETLEEETNEESEEEAEEEIEEAKEEDTK